MKFIFFAPRLHTNQHEILKGLKQKHKIAFHSIYKGKTEDYSILRPKIIAQSRLSLFIQSFFGIKDKMLIFFPNIINYFILLKKEQPDYIIIRVYGKVYPYVIALISKILKIKIIFYEQYFLDLNHLKKKNLINIIKKIEIFFRCFFFKSIIYSPIKSNQIYKNILYLPFVSNIKKNKKITQTGTVKILIVSKYQIRKNLIFSFEALETLLKKYNFEVTYVGEVSNLEHKKILHLLKEKVKNSIYKNKFKIFKNMNFKKMKLLYNKNDILLMPSNNEPASVSILEAMSQGLVVICSDTCSTRTYLPSLNKNVFKSDNKAELVKCLKYYLENKEEILKNKIINYKFCLNNYTFNNYYRILLKILKFYDQK